MKKIILLMSLVTMIISCKKNDIKDIEKNIVYKNLLSFEKLYSLYADGENTSGKFMITANTGLGTQDVEHFWNFNINGVFLNKETQLPESGVTNIFNGINVEYNSPGYSKDFKWNEAQNLFGKEIKMKLNRGQSQLSIQNSTSIDTISNYNGYYCPKVFVCTNIFPENVGSINDGYSKGAKLKPTYTFNWNSDSLNQNGVFIYIEYDPNDGLNKPFVLSNPDRLSNAIIVEDNGSYSLTPDMFLDFPLNSRLRVYIGRGNFGFIKQTDGTTTDMQLTTLTYQSGEFYYKTN